MGKKILDCMIDSNWKWYHPITESKWYHLAGWCVLVILFEFLNFKYDVELFHFIGKWIMILGIIYGVIWTIVLIFELDEFF